MSKEMVFQNTTSVHTGHKRTNQDPETTQRVETAVDKDTGVPYMVVKIKQEADYEISDEMISMEDSKMDVCESDGCSMNMTEMDQVPQIDVCEEDERKHVQDKSIPSAQFYLTSPQDDNKDKNMKSSNMFQHSQLVAHDTVLERLSEQIRHTAERTEELAVSFMKNSEHNENIIKRTDDKKVQCVTSSGEQKQSQAVTQTFDKGLVSAHTGHLLEHTRSFQEVKLYEHDFCGIEFATNNYLKRRTSTYTGEKPYKCDVCGRGFRQNSNMKTHKRTHTGEKPYTCDICGVGFTKADSVKIHKRTHTGEKPYKCDVCDVGFIHTSQLIVHKRTHTGEKPYKCDICGVGFIKNSNLKTHKRIHTGETPYKCDICGIGFNQNSNLKKHKKAHAENKSYKCNVCGVGFSKNGHLKTHGRTHTREKHYKCDVCGLRFSKKGHLKTHERIHTGEKPLQV